MTQQKLNKTNQHNELYELKYIYAAECVDFGEYYAVSLPVSPATAVKLNANNTISYCYKVLFV